MILGFGIGALTVLTPLFISETSPIEVAGPLGSLSQVQITVGIMIAYMLSYIVPIRYVRDQGETINEDIFTTQSWRIIFIIPAGISIIQTLLMLLVFRYDTPKYYRQVGKESMAEMVEDLIYKEKLDSAKDSQENMVEKEDDSDQNVSFGQLFSSKYRTALIIGLF